MRTHHWVSTDDPRIGTCSRCGWERTPQIGGLRIFGFRPNRMERWRLFIPDCAYDANGDEITTSIEVEE